MNKIETDTADLMIVETVLDAVEAFMENILRKKIGKNIRPKFPTKKTENWLAEPIILDRNELELRTVMELKTITCSSVSGGEENCFLTGGWNSLLREALEISLTQVLSELVFRDEDFSGASKNLIIQKKTQQWAKQSSLEDIAELENLGVFPIMLKNDMAWEKWRSVVGKVVGKSAEEKSAEFQVFEARKELNNFMKREGKPLVELFPSVEDVAKEISEKLSHILERSLESLKIIDIARNTSTLSIQTINQQPNDQKELVSGISILSGRPRAQSL